MYPALDPECPNPPMTQNPERPKTQIWTFGVQPQTSNLGRSGLNPECPSVLMHPTPERTHPSPKTAFLNPYRAKIEVFSLSYVTRQFDRAILKKIERQLYQSLSIHNPMFKIVSEFVCAFHIMGNQSV